MSVILNVLSTRLAELSNKKEIVCRGIIRYAVSDVVERLQQTTDYRIWRESLQTMSFQDWDIILQGGPFLERLMTIGVKNAGEVTEQLRQTLVEKQSLFTMSTTPSSRRSR